MAQYNTLAELTTDIADAIREKSGGEELISPQDFADRIRALPVLGDECDCIILFNNTKPASKYGGSWEELPQGTFIMAAGEGNAASTKVVDHGNPGGMHTISWDEMPNHFHNIFCEFGTRDNLNANPTDNLYGQVAGANAGTKVPMGETSTAGLGQSFDIRPPTVTAHVWRKIS